MNTRSAAYAWRVRAVYLLLAVAAVVLAGRLVFLQLEGREHGREFLQHQGDIRVLRTASMPVARGEILDRQGKLLAYSTPVRSVWVNPVEFERALAAGDVQDAELLASALQLPLATVEKRLGSSSRFVYLRRQASPAIANAAMELGYKGVYTETEYKRYYPAAEYAAHVVGFTNVDDQGQEGLELAFDGVLSGKAGRHQVMRNALGEAIKHIRLIEAPESPGSLQLSIDMNLQYLAYRELKAAVQQHDASSGSLVVLDVDTGEVLALVNQPSYNVNDRQQLLPERTRNRALIDVFEPGSTVKPFTMAAVLMHSSHSPGDIVDTAPGYIRLKGKTFVDPRNYGPLSITEVLAKSSQVGTIRLAMDVDVFDLRETFADVGFGEYCATGFPGEQVGFLPHHKRWEPVQQAALSFGHGMSVNTLQLARAYAVLAADGIKRPVSLFKKNESTNDDLISERVLRADVAQAVRQMMVAVVEDGTGKAASVPGYSVAGKTGTSHKVGDAGYESNRYRATFAGFAPASNPKIVTVVTINDPKSGQYFGGEITAPVFSKVMAGALRMMSVAPDRPEQFDVDAVSRDVASDANQLPNKALRG